MASFLKILLLTVISCQQQNPKNTNSLVSKKSSKSNSMAAILTAQDQCSAAKKIWDDTKNICYEKLDVSSPEVSCAHQGGMWQDNACLQKVKNITAQEQCNNSNIWNSEQNICYSPMPTLTDEEDCSLQGGNLKEGKCLKPLVLENPDEGVCQVGQGIWDSITKKCYLPPATISEESVCTNLKGIWDNEQCYTPIEDYNITSCQANSSQNWWNTETNKCYKPLVVISDSTTCDKAEGVWFENTLGIDHCLKAVDVQKTVQDLCENRGAQYSWFKAVDDDHEKCYYSSVATDITHCASPGIFSTGNCYTQVTDLNFAQAQCVRQAGAGAIWVELSKTCYGPVNVASNKLSCEHLGSVWYGITATDGGCYKNITQNNVPKETCERSVASTPTGLGGVWVSTTPTEGKCYVNALVGSGTNTDGSIRRDVCFAQDTNNLFIPSTSGTPPKPDDSGKCYNGVMRTTIATKSSCEDTSTVNGYWAGGVCFVSTSISKAPINNTNCASLIGGLWIADPSPAITGKCYVNTVIVSSTDGSIRRDVCQTQNPSNLFIPTSTSGTSSSANDTGKCYSAVIPIAITDESSCETTVNGYWVQPVGSASGTCYVSNVISKETINSSNCGSIGGVISTDASKCYVNISTAVTEGTTTSAGITSTKRGACSAKSTTAVPTSFLPKTTVGTPSIDDLGTCYTPISLTAVDETICNKTTTDGGLGGLWRPIGAAAAAAAVGKCYTPPQIADQTTCASIGGSWKTSGIPQPACYLSNAASLSSICTSLNGKSIFGIVYNGVFKFDADRATCLYQPYADTVGASGAVTSTYGYCPFGQTAVGYGEIDPVTSIPVIQCQDINDIRLSASRFNTCAIANGKYSCWGRSETIGNNCASDNAATETNNSATGCANYLSKPQVVKFSDPVVALGSTPALGSNIFSMAMGRWNSCVIVNAKIYCSGRKYMTMGTDDQFTLKTPTGFGSPAAFYKKMVSYDASTCLLYRDYGSDQLICWGANNFEQTGVPTLQRKCFAQRGESAAVYFPDPTFNPTSAAWPYYQPICVDKDDTANLTYTTPSAAKRRLLNGSDYSGSYEIMEQTFSAGSTTAAKYLHSWDLNSFRDIIRVGYNSDGATNEDIAFYDDLYIYNKFVQIDIPTVTYSSSTFPAKIGCAKNARMGGYCYSPTTITTTGSGSTLLSTTAPTTPLPTYNTTDNPLKIYFPPYYSTLSPGSDGFSDLSLLKNTYKFPSWLFSFSSTSPVTFLNTLNTYPWWMGLNTSDYRETSAGVASTTCTASTSPACNYSASPRAPRCTGASCTLTPNTYMRNNIYTVAISSGSDQFVDIGVGSQHVCVVKKIAIPANQEVSGNPYELWCQGKMAAFMDESQLAIHPNSLWFTDQLTYTGVSFTQAPSQLLLGNDITCYVIGGRTACAGGRDYFAAMPDSSIGAASGKRVRYVDLEGTAQMFDGTVAASSSTLYVLPKTTCTSTTACVPKTIAAAKVDSKMLTGTTATSDSIGFGSSVMKVALGHQFICAIGGDPLNKTTSDTLACGGYIGQPSSAGATSSGATVNPAFGYRVLDDSTSTTLATGFRSISDMGGFLRDIITADTSIVPAGFVGTTVVKYKDIASGTYHFCVSTEITATPTGGTPLITRNVYCRGHNDWSMLGDFKIPASITSSSFLYSAAAYDFKSSTSAAGSVVNPKFFKVTPP